MAPMDLAGTDQYDTPHRSLHTANESAICSSVPSQTCGDARTSEGVKPKAIGKPFRTFFAILRHDDGVSDHADLRAVDAAAAGVPNPAQLTIRRGSNRLERRGAGDRTSAETGSYSDDVRLASGELEHSLAGPADQQRGMRLLDGFRLTIESLDLVVLALRGHRAVLKQPFHQPNRFLHSIDTDRRIIEWNTGHLVLVRQPTSSRSPLDPTCRDDVQCRKFLACMTG